MLSIVVTGGGTGIGYTVAETFTRRGAQVTITGRRENVLKVAAALGQLPDRVDVLVNTAGGNTDLAADDPAPGDLTALAATWRANLDANLMSAVMVTAALEPRLNRDARVLTIGSIAARK